ncbi:MAG: FtsW/RodA/SpoVE family cell cycle protein [Streptomycetales bacterium]
MSKSTSPPSERTRRGTELVMILFALGIGLAAYAAVGLGAQGRLPVSLLSYGLGLAVLAAAAHLAVRRFAPYADPLLLPAVILLNGLGLALIHRIDLAEAEAARQFGGGPPDTLAPAQLTWTTVGVGLFILVLVLVRDHRTLQRYTYTAMVAGLALLLLPLTPGLGATIHGARIWIQVAGFSFQPAEAAKLVLMVFFAGYLVVKRDVLALASKRVAGIDLPRGRDLGPIIVAWILSLGVLVFERDLGTSLLFFGAFVITLYIATERTSWLIFGIGMFLSGAFLAYTIFGHVQERVTIWLDPFSDPQGQGYQLVQALYGLSSGGILGSGLGQGRPELVPFAASDFVIAAVGEELGLTGLMAVLLVYGFIVERGLHIAIAARDQFGKLLAAGFAVTIALQVFVVVGGVTKLIPLTGLTTPFLSYGGSSLVANWALIALLLRISDSARQPLPPPSPALDEAMTQVVRR